MKRLAVAGLLAVATIALVLAILPRLVSSSAVRESLLERALEITGRKMTFSGVPQVKFSPYLGIEIHNVSFRDEIAGEDSEPILQMPVLAGKLSVTAALRGAIELTEYEFIRPVFNLTVEPGGRTSWSFAEGKMWQALSEARELRAATASGTAPDLSKLSPIRLGTFKVTDGIVNYVNRATGRTESITSLYGTFSWPNVRSAWSFNGNAIWRGEAISATTNAQTPIMLLAGGNSAITAEFKSEPASLTFKGEANRLSDFFVTGETTIKSSSLRRMVALLGNEPVPGTGLEAFSASGTASGTLSDLQLAKAAIELEGNRFSGNLRFSFNEAARNKLSGTLASELLDLTPYAGLAGQKDGRTALFAMLSKSDVDLRISAKRINANGVELSDYAGGLIARGGEVVVDIGNAAYGGGIIAGSLLAGTGNEAVPLTISIDAAGINLGDLDFLRNASRLMPDGPANVRLRMSSALDGPGNILKQANGNISVKMKDGNIAGMDFSEVIKNLQPGSSNGENIPIATPLAATAVSNFEMNAVIANGTAWVQNSGFDVLDYRARLSGKADISGGSIAIWGGLETRGENAKPLEGGQFFVGGTLFQPLLVPQFRSGQQQRSAPSDGNGQTNSAKAIQ